METYNPKTRHCEVCERVLKSSEIGLCASCFKAEYDEPEDEDLDYELLGEESSL